MQYNCIQLLLVLFTQYVWLPLINGNRLFYHSVTFYNFTQIIKTKFYIPMFYDPSSIQWGWMLMYPR